MPGELPADLPSPIEVTTVAETDPQGGASRPASIVPPTAMRRRLEYTESIEAHFSTVPMPAPDTLARLKALYPNAPEIIFGQMVSQADHRQTLESSVIATKNTLALRGQIIGGIVGVVGLVGSLIVVALGHDAAGGTIGGACLIGLVSVFVIGQDSQRKNLAAKAEVQAKIANGEPVEKLEDGKAAKVPVNRQPPKTRDKRKNGGKKAP